MDTMKVNQAKLEDAKQRTFPIALSGIFFFLACVFFLWLGWDLQNSDPWIIAAVCFVGTIVAAGLEAIIRILGSIDEKLKEN